VIDLSKYFWIVWIILPLFNAFLYFAWFEANNTRSKASGSEAQLFAILAISLTIIILLMVVKNLTRKNNR